MKTFTHTISLSALLLSTAITPSSATSAPSPNSPRGYITTYDAADCLNTDVLGSTTDTRQTIVLPEQLCVGISGKISPGIMSFQGGVSVACPKGKTGTIMVYQSADCSVNSVTTGTDAGTLPAAGPGQCKNILPMGLSARFRCV